MSDALALVPSETRQPPTIPFAWNYEQSVGGVKQVIYKWKNITLEIADELYVAHEKLSTGGRSRNGQHTWDSYCEAVGVEKRTANRWLERVFGSGTFVPLFSSESVEWYTPTDVVNRVVRLFGEIDLDPCSNESEPNVPARQHYTKTDDGLTQEWPGRVYMNPPYGREILSWTRKLVGEIIFGRTEEAIALVPARTDTDWFYLFRDWPVCFIHGRLRFNNSEISAPFPSAACYFGNRLDDFRDAFADMGDVWTRVRDDLA